jgi:hypothetical protein
MRVIWSFMLAVVLSGCDQKANNDELADTVHEINQKCPVMVDSETRIDGLEVLGENTLRYNYSLVNVQRVNVDTSQFRRAMWPGILGMIRVSSDMQKLRDQNTTIEYSYKDRNGNHIYTFVVRPQDYNSN